jgi:hypothetical protein
LAVGAGLAALLPLTFLGGVVEELAATAAALVGEDTLGAEAAA